MKLQMQGLASLITGNGTCLVQTSNIDTWRESIQSLNFVASPRLTPGNMDVPFDARLDRIRVGSITMMRRQQSVSLTGETTGVARDSVLVTLPPIGGKGHLSFGRESGDLTASAGLIDDINEATCLRTSADADWMSIIIPRASLEQTCSALIGRRPKTPLRFAPRIDGHALKWVHFLFAAAQGSEAAALHKLLAVNLEQVVISGLLLSQPHSHTDHLTDPVGPALPKTLRRAIVYMEDHLGDPITIADVAAHVGVGVRSLQLAFQGNKGCTPKAWLQNRRLDQAYAALIAGGKTVTEVAFAWGFSNPGDFAVLYRHRFGCTPSQTVRDLGCEPPISQK